MTLFSVNTSLVSLPVMYNDTSHLNTTVRPMDRSTLSVHDIEYSFPVRLSILYVQIVIGIIGALLLFYYMIRARRSIDQPSPKRLTRVNSLILNLCVADLMVICFSCLSQLVWEHFYRSWLAGDVVCRIFKMMQLFPLCASTNMLVVIAVDRHQAITAPLKKQFSVMIMASIGWGMAILCTSPALFVFNVRYDNNKNMTMCENIFRNKDKSHRQAFITYAALINFFIPLILLCICYIRIFLKIARKASDSRTSKRQSFKPGKIHLTSSTTSATLHSAKLKTLRMTVVIVSGFIVCGLPYFVAELIMSYGDFGILGRWVHGLLGGIATANSAINPYIFLFFSVNLKCLRNLKLCPAKTGPNNRQLTYNGSVRSREYSSTVYSRTPMTGISTESFELSTAGNNASRIPSYNRAFANQRNGKIIE